MAPVEKYDLWGYVNRDGEQVVDFQFVWASTFESGRSRVLTESGWAILGSDFELNRFPDVTMLGTVEESPVPVVGSEGWTFFNPREGRENRFGTYDAILPFAEGLGVVKRGSFWGYVNPDGQEIIEPKFEAAGRFRENRARVKIGGQWGYVAHPERSSNVRAETVPLNVREGPEERTYSDTKLEESLLEEYPTWFHPGRDRYVNVGRGVLERRWHREETVPDSSLSFEETLFEVDRFPYEFPDAVQHEAAEELFFRSLAAAKRYGWADYTRAREVGYRPNQEDGTHLHHLENSTDSRVLVPAKPEYLIYYSGGDKNNRRLTGFMYLNKELEGTAPQIGGGLTRWHYHRYSSEKCFRDKLLILHEDEECRRGVRQSRAPEMLHLWFMNHPQGTFGTRMVFFADLLPDWTREYRPKFTP